MGGIYTRQELGWLGKQGLGAGSRSREGYTNAPFTSLGSTRPGPGGAAYSGSAICLSSAEISTGGLGVGRLFYFFNAAGSGSRCHSSEPDWRRGREMSRKTGEKEMEASMLQEEGRTGSREGR